MDSLIWRNFIEPYGSVSLAVAGKTETKTTCLNPIDESPESEYSAFTCLNPSSLFLSPPNPEKQSTIAMAMTHPFSRDYEVLEEIGRGKFGVVSRCISRATGEHFAVKVIDKSLVAGDPIDGESLTTEPKILHLLSLSSSSSSTHITRLHGAYDSPTHLHLVLDLFPFPSLFSLLHLRHRLPESDARAIARNLLQAILHCQQNGVVHRDIKPENVLIDPNTKRIKLCDFGSAAVKTAAPMTEVVGTPYYVAPEVLEGSGYGEKVDVWSAGVVLYAMLAGFPPFHGETTVEVFEKVLRGNLRFPASAFTGVSPEVKGLLRRMLCKEVSRRFSAQEALRHPWFASEGQPAT